MFPNRRLAAFVAVFLVCYLDSSRGQEYLDIIPAPETDTDFIEVENATVDYEIASDDDEEPPVEVEVTIEEVTEEPSLDSSLDTTATSPNVTNELPTSASDAEDEPNAAYVDSGDCSASAFGCCDDTAMPSHGLSNLGCCTASEFGCCPDNLTPANGPYGEGCNCSSTEFGCCPDQVTPAAAANFSAGCGCQYTDWGCCPDQSTAASGPDYEGCDCDTYEFGCCPDGVSVAAGHNLDGCPECNSEHGCCPDGITPRGGEAETAEDDQSECGCEASMFGCCLDGESFATGPHFEGCQSEPGKFCHIDSNTGPCNNYTSKWFFDMEWGGCNRFWYGGCEPGKNHFEDQASCEAECVNPRGSGVCYLKKVVGPCEGRYNEWFYDYERQRCAQFVYSGCLGNGNRFQTKQECEDICILPAAAAERPTRDSARSVCDLPKAEGACSGNFSRWYYDSNEGTCTEFNYSGCEGNANRFVSEGECSAACRHKAKQHRTDRVCKQYVESGDCTADGGQNATEARWGYDEMRRRCVPFYYAGCGGNENSFESKAACEAMCPTTFPPIIQLPRGSEILAERNKESAVLSVSVRANPPPVVKWFRHGVEISPLEGHYDLLSDFSLHIVHRVKDIDGGRYVIRADNGIGEPATKTIELIVYPLYSSAKIKMDKTVFSPEADVVLNCEVRGYPPPTIRWFKLPKRRASRDRQEIVEERPHSFIETYPVSTVVTGSNLLLKNVTDRHSGEYMCQASSEHFPIAVDRQRILVQYGPGDRCVDRDTFQHHCAKVVEHKYCGNKYYGSFCCRSCTEAGYAPGGLGE